MCNLLTAFFFFCLFLQVLPSGNTQYISACAKSSKKIYSSTKHCVYKAVISCVKEVDMSVQAHVFDPNWGRVLYAANVLATKICLLHLYCDKGALELWTLRCIILANLPNFWKSYLFSSEEMIWVSYLMCFVFWSNPFFSYVIFL